MEHHENEIFRQQFEEMCRRAIKSVENEYKRKLEVVETFLAIISPESCTQGLAKRNHIASSTRTKAYPGKPELKENKLNQLQLISQVLQSVEGEISQPKVIALLKSNHPEWAGTITPPRVSTLLRKLHEQGVLELLRPGAGSRPSVYSLVNTTEAQ